MPDILAGRNRNHLTIVISGREIVHSSARLFRTMDTCVDQCNAVMPWFPGKDPELDRITRQYSYSDCQIYIGNDLTMEGILYNVFPRERNDGITKELEIYSKTADIVDSTVIPPYEANNITLSTRCKQQCGPFGIDIEIGNGVDLTVPALISQGRWQNYYRVTDIPDSFRIAMGHQNEIIVGQVYRAGGFQFRLNSNGTYSIDSLVHAREEYRFARVSAEQTETIFEHLKKLAAQRGFLLSCTKNGNLLIIRPNITGEPVGLIDKINPQTEEWETKFNGRNRWAYYRAIASSSRSGRRSGAGEAHDPVCRSPRTLTFQAEDNLPGEAPNAALWRKNKSVADAMEIKFPVNSWYSPNGSLWEPNTRINVKNATLGINDPYPLLITRVEYKEDDNGSTGELQLKPPSAYGVEPEIEEPWLQ